MYEYDDGPSFLMYVPLNMIQSVKYSMVW